MNRSQPGSHSANCMHLVEICDKSLHVSFKKNKNKRVNYDLANVCEAIRVTVRSGQEVNGMASLTLSIDQKLTLMTLQWRVCSARHPLQSSFFSCEVKKRL